MRVELTQYHRVSYNKLINDLNKTALSFTPSKYKKNRDKNNIISKRNITVMSKKKKLTKLLHDLTIQTFSIKNLRKDTQKKIIPKIKHNIDLLRKIVLKLKDINHYFEEIVLTELNIIKRDVKLYSSKNPTKLIEKAHFKLQNKDIYKLEHITFTLIEKIITFDKTLLKNYKSKQEKIIKKEKTNINDLKNIIKKQTELLNHIEAKLPPSKQISTKLLSNKIYNNWVPRLLALLLTYESEVKKEERILSKIKRNARVRKLLYRKITSLEKEKLDLIHIKQKRLLNSNKLDNETQKLRLLFQDFTAIKNL